SSERNSASDGSGGTEESRLGPPIGGSRSRFSLCLVLAGGHAFVGRVVLDLLPRDLPATRFGDGAFTRGLFVFTSHAVAVMQITTGAVLLALSRGEPADERGQVVFLVGAAYAAAT